MAALRENFRPEFINRVDEIIIFHPLDKKVLEIIVDLQLQRVEKNLLEKEISVEVTAGAKNYLTQKGFDPVFGARPLKRVIQNEILDELALEIIEGKIGKGKKVKIGVKGGKIIFSR